MFLKKKTIIEIIIKNKNYHIFVLMLECHSYAQYTDCHYHDCRSVDCRGAHEAVAFIVEKLIN